MFKTWKENRENKKDILFYQAFLLRTLAEVVLEFKKSQETAKESGITQEDALKILNSLKGVDQKDIVTTLVNAIKSNETVAKNETVGN